VDLTGSHQGDLQNGVVQVPQRHGLFGQLTVRQNVLMGAYIIRRQRAHLARRYDELSDASPCLLNDTTIRELVVRWTAARR